MCLFGFIGLISLKADANMENGLLSTSFVRFFIANELIFFRVLYITAKPSVLNQNGFCDLDSRYINSKNFMVCYLLPIFLLTS